VRFMHVAVIGLALLLSPTIAFAGENPVLGTWKLKSFVREVTATGEKINQMGEHPNGYLSYSADGRMYEIVHSGQSVEATRSEPDR
jgi:Lipocalin-like domain